LFNSKPNGRKLGFNPPLTRKQQNNFYDLRVKLPPVGCYYLSNNSTVEAFREVTASLSNKTARERANWSPVHTIPLLLNVKQGSWTLAFSSISDN